MTNEEVKDDLKKMYNDKAGVYCEDYSTEAGKYFMKRKIKTALKLGGFKNGSKLLEVGCADGPYTFEFAKMGFSMTGVDLSPECINYVSEKAKKDGKKNLKFIACDAEDLSIFSDNSFDGVISFSCLRYLPNPQKAINEIYRVVKKGENVVIDFPNKRSPWFKGLKPLLLHTSHIHDHHYSTKEVKEFLKKAGFQDIVTKTILYTPKIIDSKTLKIMKVVDKVGEKPPFNTFASIIMCKGKKPDS